MYVCILLSNLVAIRVQQPIHMQANLDIAYIAKWKFYKVDWIPNAGLISPLSNFQRWVKLKLAHR